ncbi:Hypothetical predicted protein [Podarcis lilfordi]|uniref:Uncharacterized protein n=1 Tax=Podarcis lilfordi TaxID=74358 RepID=A0AA35KX79_9SAUR|nr:Hypothetical predicted protein [Podarcis lilfordi]
MIDGPPFPRQRAVAAVASERARTDGLTGGRADGCLGGGAPPPRSLFCRVRRARRPERNEV